MGENTVKLFIEFGERKYTQVVKINGHFPYIIGRQSPDLTIKDPQMSRKHCQLVVKNGLLYIEDLGSSNGTEVNGAATKRSRLLLDDHIRIGSTHLKVIKIDVAKGPKAKKTSSF